jgi:hypothetical protein
MFFNFIEPGYVKNIRYAFESDSLYIINCDEPDEPNGHLIVTELFLEYFVFRLIAKQC